MARKIKEHIGYVLRHRLAKNTGLYTAAEILNKAIPFLLLPVMTRYLSPSDYGIVAIFMAYVGILCVFVGLSAHGAVTVNFFRMDRSQLPSYVFNVFLILIVSASCVFLLTTVLVDELVKRLSLPPLWISLGVIIAFCRFLTLINLILWQAENRPKPYCAYSVSQLLLDASLSIVFVVTLSLGWSGRLIGTSAATILFALLSIVFVLRRNYVSFRIDLIHIRDALAFGVPLIPHVLSVWFMTSVDRFLITNFVGLADTGIYTVGYQFGMIIGIIAVAFNQAWAPIFYEMIKDVDAPGKIKLARLTYLYFIVILLLALALAIVARPVIGLVLGPEFIESFRFVFWIAVSYAFNGMYFMVCLYVMYSKKTHILSLVSLIVGVLHVFISYHFIQLYGAIGAAQATLISFFIRFVFVWFLSTKVCPMPWILALRKA